MILGEHIVVSVDVTDISGELQTDLTHNIRKTRLSSTGEKVDDIVSSGTVLLSFTACRHKLIRSLFFIKTPRVNWTRLLLLGDPITAALAMAALNPKAGAVRPVKTSGKRI